MASKHAKFSTDNSLFRSRERHWRNYINSRYTKNIAVVKHAIRIAGVNILEMEISAFRDIKCDRDPKRSRTMETYPLGGLHVVKTQISVTDHILTQTKIRKSCKFNEQMNSTEISQDLEKKNTTIRVSKETYKS